MPHFARPRYLFAHWKDIASRLRSAEHLALFCDFDGTLAPFHPRPDQVLLPPSVRRAVTCLARHPKVYFSIVTGRRAADVRRRVGVTRIHYFGLHGWERDGSMAAHAGALRARLARAREHITAQLAPEPVWVEDKEYSFVVHFRDAPPPTVGKVKRAIQFELELFGGRLRTLNGRNSLEVLPREIKGKGSLVRSLLRAMFPKPLAIYIGDDATDESAFAILHGRGITVHVGGSSATYAQFYLRNPVEVRNFLVRVAREIQ